MRVKIGLIIISISIIVLAFYVFSACQEQNALKMDTVSYLENKGYDCGADIAEIYIVNVGQADTFYAAVVTFKDEPMVNYFYAYIGSPNKLQQVDFDVVNNESNQPLKHRES